MVANYLEYEKYCTRLPSREVLVKIKYTKESGKFTKDIDTRNFLVYDTFRTIREARCAVVKGLMYLKGLEAGIP